MLMKINKIKSFIALVIMGAFVLGSVPAQTSAIALKNILPIPTPSFAYHLKMTVLWGNVEGPVQDATKTYFDGSISVNGGHVKLEKAIAFEQHDADHDKVTNYDDPVMWQSLIYNKYDGVRVDIRAEKHSMVYINTVQGGMTLPIRTVVRAAQNEEILRLNLPDGKEIVVKVALVNDTPDIQPAPFHIALVWGGPVPATKPTENIVAMQAVNGTFNNWAQYPTLVKQDFSGAVTSGNGAALKLVKPIWFESNDKITHEWPNYVSWKSSIAGHLDGVLLKVAFDNGNSADDTLSFKTRFNGGFDKTLNLKELYKKGYDVNRFFVNGKMYVMVAVVIKGPLCASPIADTIGACDNTITPLPVKNIKPLTIVPKPLNTKPLYISPAHISPAKQKAISNKLHDILAKVKALQMKLGK